MSAIRLSVVLALSMLPLATAQAQVASGDDLFARDTLRIDTIICPFKGEIEYEPGEIECGLLQVPENREKPDSRFIELHFVRLNSTWDDEGQEEESGEGIAVAPGRRDDPVVYLTGGPGAPVEYYVKRFKKHGIRKHRDLIILEQRGIGHSNDFCPDYYTRKPEAGNVPSFAEHLEAGINDAIECAANAAAEGVDLSGYNSVENARDVKALRLAMGFEKWNVWGISYGSILGQMYLKVDPEGIRAIVLDAIVPLDVRDNPWAWRTIHWYDRDLEKLDALCQAHPDCAKRYPDLGGRIREAVLSVADDPIAVEVEDTETFPSGTAYLFTDVVAYLPFAFFYEQSNYPGMPGLVHAWADAVESRDEALLKAVALVTGAFFDSSQGMTNAIICLDGDAEAQVVAGAEDIEAHPVLGSAVGSVAAYERRARLCWEQGMPPRDAAEFALVETDVPALLIAGDMDPITPPPLAKAVVPGFANGTYVEFPYAGHGPSRSVDCAGDMLNAFFDHPMAEPDLSCVGEMEPPDFFVPLFTTSAGPRLMVKTLEDKRSLAVPAVWGGASLLVSVLGFLVLTLAPLGRRIDRRVAVPASGARLAGWLASALATLAAAVLGSAAVVTFKSFEILPLFGLVPWARFGAAAGLLAGVAGIATLVLAVRARSREKLPIGTLLGLLITGLAATSLSVFLAVWDLSVF